MKLKVFTLRFSGSPEGFDDRPLQEFIADKEVIEFSEHFFTRDNTPFLTILIAYRPLTEDGARRPVPQRDPRNEFDAREKEAYDALRTWRAAAAKMEGIPPYLIANNSQLAASHARGGGDSGARQYASMTGTGAVLSMMTHGRAPWRA